MTITSANIYKAIRTRLTTDISSVTTIIKDFKNPQPPCFYIEYNSSSDSIVANNTTQTSYDFSVYYFSADKTLIDLTNFDKVLRKSFLKPLKIEYTENEINKKHYADAILSTDIDEDDYIVQLDLTYNVYYDSEVENPYDEPVNDHKMMILELE